MTTDPNDFDERQDRWDAILAAFKEWGILKYERISAVKKPFSEFSPEVYSGMSTDKMPTGVVEAYLAGSCGCKMSHLKALQMARSRNYSSVLILEDDCVFYPGFQEAFQNAFKWLKNIDWHMFYFGGNHRSRRKARYFKPGLLKIQCTYQAHAYAVSRDVYEFIIKKVETSNKEIDVIYADEVHPVKNCFCIFPGVAGQKIGFSSIINQECNRNIKKSPKK